MVNINTSIVRIGAMKISKIDVFIRISLYHVNFTDFHGTNSDHAGIYIDHMLEKNVLIEAKEIKSWKKYSKVKLCRKLKESVDWNIGYELNEKLAF
jgi:hypothetical protein